MHQMYVTSTYLFILLLAACAGSNDMVSVCDFDKSCLSIYNTLKGLFEDDPADSRNLCALSQDLKDCMKRQSRKCRGDLNYHFFDKLVRDLMANPGLGKNCASGANAGKRNSDGQNRTGNGNTLGHGNTNRGSSTRNFGFDKCSPKIASDAPLASCAVYGLTNLKTFSESINYTDINYCSLSGAWSLIDTPEFAVQITNKGGLSPLPKDITTTTLVTVIIKSNQCSERRTYQATFNEVPRMFTDGSSTASSVYLESIREGEFVKIHFPYLRAVIDVIKITDRLPFPSLVVTITLPQQHVVNLMSEPTKLRGIPLCFYACPKTATIRPRSTDSHQIANTNCSLTPPPTSSSSSSASDSLEILSTSTSTSGRGALMSSTICTSLYSIQNILANSVVVDQKLAFPGEENLGNGHDENSSFHVENSALTSQSTGVYRFHSLLLYFSLTVFLLYS